MSLLNILLLLFPQFIIILFFIFLLDKKKISFDVIDNPDNIRKLHDKPTSSIGGLFILISVLYLLILEIINFSYLSNDYNFFLEGFRSKISFYLISFSFFLLGYFDDKIDIRSSIKIFLILFLCYFAQILNKDLTIRALYFSFLENPISLDKDLGIFFTTFAIMAFINSFNMFDGKNLQIGIYSLVCLFFMILKLENIILFSLTLSIIFFLTKNYNGKLFIGNNGTHLLGYILSFLLIKIYNSAEVFIYADEIFILMMLPGIDLIRLLFKRIKKNKNPLHGDLDHLHHILSLKFKNYQIQIILLSIVIISLVLFNIINFYISCFFVLISYTTLIIFSRK